MKKILSLLIVAFFATNALFADDVTVQQALQIASQFSKTPAVSLAKARRAQAAPASPQLAYTVKSKADGKDNVYIINYGNDQGFVVVSGESGTDADVLGYCDHGSFSYDKAPIQMKDLLNSYSESIDALRKNPSLARRASRRVDDGIGTIIIGPLLNTQWNQWGPYNNLCPAGCPTGCVPTAIAQVMYYWRWPEKTIGEVQGEDFSGRSYDWDNMLSNYEAMPYTAEQAQAVAQLMADIGKVYGAKYSPEGSPAGLSDYLMVKNFGYEPGSVPYSGETSAELALKMIKELDERRPMLYAGYPKNGEEGDGHALVVDGYTSNNYFHFNYGWGGVCDGFYKDAIIPFFAHNAQIFTKVRPWDVEYVEIGDINYALLNNGEAHIYDYLKTDVENVVLEIPATISYKGKTYKVTRICKHSFLRKGHFSKLTLGENVAAIDPYSFIYSNIDELVLSDKMEEVPDEAFLLTYVKTLTIGASVKRIGNKAFYLCPLTKVISKSPAFEVGDNAFTNSSPSGEWLGCITSLGEEAFAMAKFSTAPDFKNLTTIGPRAFASCSFPGTTFKIPGKLKSIAPDAFWGGNVFFEIDEKNPYFKVLYYTLLLNSNSTSLVLTGKPSATIGDELFPFPETMVKMERGSITSRIRTGSVHSVVIPNTVVDMEGAFCNCESLASLTCLAVEPPVITDATFNDKLFENSPNVPLYVPEGTADLYRNAPGWRKFTNIIDDEPYVEALPQEMEYNMVVHATGEDQRIINIPVREISDIHVADDNSAIIVSRSGKEDVTTAVAKIDSITWMQGFVYENAEVFDLDEEHLTAEAQKCTVTLEPTVIDENVQMSICNAVLKPNAIEGCTRGVAVDISLSNGVHELSGTAEITIPVDPQENETVCAAYYNQETGEWDPVVFKYDETKKAVVITTDHLSLFSAFFVVGSSNTATELLKTGYEALPNVYNIGEAASTLKKLMRDIVTFSEKDAMENEWKDNYGFWQSIGIDGGWNYLQALGVSSEAIGHATDVVGYLGTAICIYDVLMADIKGDDVGVAANTLKAVLGYSSSALASAIGTGIMQASMGTVAFIGVALEKFGTMVQQRKVDLYRKAYSIYYSKAGAEVVAGTSKYGNKWYRTEKDWYDFFYPYFAKEGMTLERLNAVIEKAVNDYCDRFWEDADAQAMCVAEAKAQGLSSWMYPDESTRRTISDEYFAELMNGQLKSVFQALRNNLGVQAGNRYSKGIRDYIAMVNTLFGVRIQDSSWKEGEKSKYAGWTITFSDLPSNLDSKYIKRVISDKGTASVGYFTMWTLIKNDMKCKLVLYDENDVPQKEFPFKLPNKRGKVVIDLDIDKGGMEVEAPELKDLGLVYDPDNIDIGYTCAGMVDDGNGGLEYYDGGSTGIWLALDHIPRAYRVVTEKARFCYEIEKFFKQHDFITVDKYGNIKIGDDLAGKFENNGLEGSGKFTINTSHNFVEKTISKFLKGYNERGIEELPLLNGTIQHKISGEFKVTRKSVDSQEYEITYTGEGTYQIKAEVISRIDNYNFSKPMGSQNAKLDDLTTGEKEQEGTVRLNYSLKLKSK